MGLIETDAIVLRTYSLAEADKIVVCLTRKAGVVRAVARGARRLKSRFGAGLEPFTLLNLSYYEKEGRELVTVRQAEILRSYFSLINRAEIIAALGYMSEILLEFAPPHEPNERLFRMVSACVEAIARSPEELHAIIRYFEIWALKLAGFLPDLLRCSNCRKRFDENEAAYLNAESQPRCSACSNGQGIKLSSAMHAQLRAMQRLSPSDFAQLACRLPNNTREELAQVAGRLMGRVLEREPRIPAPL